MYGITLQENSSFLEIGVNVNIWDKKKLFIQAKWMFNLKELFSFTMQLIIFTDLQKQYVKIFGNKV